MAVLEKRIIVCLDVKDGRTTKGVKFRENIDVGDPVAMAQYYYEEGADELVFYDITASAEKRKIMIEVLARVAEKIFIPFSVGGGIASVQDMRAVLLAGAEKVSVNSQAVRNPRLIARGAAAFGQQCIVLGMDVLKDTKLPSGYRVVIDGGRVTTELDALAWAKKAEDLGAGEIVLNSIDADGTKNGYELDVTRLISDAVQIPVVASGGAGNPEHIALVFEEAHADAALIASMVHFGTYSIRHIKDYLVEKGIPLRMEW
jgi:cyclase